MPFVSKSTSITIFNGSIEPPKRGELPVPPLVLACIGSVGLDPTTDEYKKFIIEGDPREDGTSWSRYPIVRITTENLNKEDWDRFLSWFEVQKGKVGALVDYQPEVYDVVDLEYEVRALPSWVLEYLQKKKHIEAARSEFKLTHSSTEKRKFADDAAYEKFLKAIKERFDKEAQAEAQEKEKLEQEKQEKARLKQEKLEKVNA